MDLIEVFKQCETEEEKTEFVEGLVRRLQVLENGKQQDVMQVLRTDSNEFKTANATHYVYNYGSRKKPEISVETEVTNRDSEDWMYFTPGTLLKNEDAAMDLIVDREKQIKALYLAKKYVMDMHCYTYLEENPGIPADSISYFIEDLMQNDII